jgi:myo-inositol-1(or 4)-monophosphatase
VVFRHGEAWVVDVLDGAVHYVQGLPQWCVSLTLVRNHVPVETVLHSPVFGETFTAEAGHGAALNGKPIQPSAKQDLSIALLTASHPPFTAQPVESGQALTAVLATGAAIRNLGPTSWQIADAGAGRVDAFWQYGIDDTNLLGGALIAQGAGAIVTGTSGAPWKPGSPSSLAAAPGLHAELIRALP